MHGNSNIKDNNTLHITNLSLFLIPLTFHHTFVTFTATYVDHFLVCYYSCFQSRLLLHIQEPLSSSYRSIFYGTLFAKNASVTFSPTLQRLHPAVVVLMLSQLAFVMFGVGPRRITKLYRSFDKFRSFHLQGEWIWFSVGVLYRSSSGQCVEWRLFDWSALPLTPQSAAAFTETSRELHSSTRPIHKLQGQRIALILGKWPTWCTNSFLCICFYL